MTDDPEKLEWIGRVLGIAAWVFITYALWVISEGGAAEWLLLFGIGLAGLAVLCFVRAKQLRR